MGWFRPRVPVPVAVSVQTRSAVQDGTMGFAFRAPYRTPVPLLGAGIVVRTPMLAEQGRLAMQPQLAPRRDNGIAVGSWSASALAPQDYLPRQIAAMQARQ